MAKEIDAAKGALLAVGPVVAGFVAGFVVAGATVPGFCAELLVGVVPPATGEVVVAEAEGVAPPAGGAPPADGVADIGHPEITLLPLHCDEVVQNAATP